MAGLRAVDWRRLWVVVLALVSRIWDEIETFEQFPASCFMAGARATVLANLDLTSTFDIADDSSRPAKTHSGGLETSFGHGMTDVVVMRPLSSSVCVVAFCPLSHTGSSLGAGYGGRVVRIGAADLAPTALFTRRLSRCLKPPRRRLETIPVVE